MRARSRLRGRRRARRHRGQRRLGERRVDRRRGRRIGPLAAAALARDRGADQRRARPPLDLRLAAGPGADAREFMGRAPARRGRLGPPAAPGACPGGALAYDAADAAMSPRRLAVSLARDRGVARGPGRPQRGQRRRRADRVRAGGRRSGRGRRRAGRLPRGSTAVRAARVAPKTEMPIYDDYAHHPTEVAATIAAARTLAPARLVAVFQPHLYSRTRALAREFGRALAGADIASSSPSTRRASAPRTSRGSTGS